ncbi:hypothetical protein HK100_000192 [Physocladia obscura]|uniref:Uncharacterized protein n=1 Tax=Physocladia obscura TaxID=109957 RepID=A0AAD5T4Q9_9FUNG|nr:hypothetical protein HK100_000192 [Physocladia obscura]
MQIFKTIITLGIATVANADCSASAGSTCTTSGGGWLVIISPFANASYTSGGAIDLTWDVCGNDTTFNAASVSFEIASAADTNNIVSITDGSLGSATVKVGELSTTVPTAISDSTTYTIKSSYHDSTSSKWIYCFGNIFAVTGASASSSSSSSSSSTVVASSASDIISVAIGAVVLAATLAF